MRSRAHRQQRLGLEQFHQLKPLIPAFPHRQDQSGGQSRASRSASLPLGGKSQPPEARSIVPNN